MKGLKGLRWSIEKATAYMKQYGEVKGSNYVPAYCYNGSHMWFEFDEKAIDRELGWARDIGLNSIRVFTPCFVYQDDRDRQIIRENR